MISDRIEAAGFADIWARVRRGQCLSFEDGMRLFSAEDAAAVGAMANHVRERLHGDVAYFNRNVHVNATNVCEASCIFCSFARLKTGDADAWTMTPAQAAERVQALGDELLTEVHVVGGLNPDVPFDWYLGVIRALRDARPELHVKAYTAVEVAWFAERFGLSVEAVLGALRAAGVDSLPGGGAEIFAPRARRKLCHDKVDADGWLDVHRTAHRMGMPTNCTMLFGAIETTEERVDHLLRLRALQDEGHAAGFQTFIPLKYHAENNRLARLGAPSGTDALRTVAVSRLLLDNIPHIKAYWPMLGVKDAQVALHFGADDLDGTVREEHIYHMAGARTPQGLSRDEIVRLVRHAGRLPVERDTRYQVVRRDDAPVEQEVPAYRAGVVGYTNALPLTRFLSGEVRAGHPSEVARWLENGEVDVALLPVGALLQSTGLHVVPDHAIGCDGAVGSVLVVGERPPEQWSRVLLDGASCTSVLLARLLLGEVEFVEVPAGTAIERAASDEGAVVIGDLARDLPARFTHRIDLGALWKERTGLPFVFAVWAGRSDLDPAVVDHLRLAAARGRSALADGTLDHPDGRPLSAADVAYLRGDIRYPLDDAAMIGLRRFAALARARGLVASAEVALFRPPSRIDRPPNLRDVDSVLARAGAGERLNFDDAMLLEERASLTDLGAAADLRRRALHPGDEVTYIISRNVNYTNVCTVACKFCAFWRSTRSADAYVLTREQMGAKLQELVDVGGVEVLLQGGLHPELGIEYYEDLFRWVKSEFPLNLHALSPDEVVHIMRVSDLSMGTVLDRLVAAGLDSLPGGGAEILDDEVRHHIAAAKSSTAEWLEVMRQAHLRGLKASCTMMFGVGEQSHHRIRHLARLRDLQDDTGGFTAFICWTFQPDHTRLVPSNNSGAEWLRVNALSRLVLDNIPNNQASWVTQGPGLAEIGLRMGCNDFGSVMLEENVVSAAGTTYHMTVAEVERSIRAAGFVPVRRNMAYDHVGSALTSADGRPSAPAPGAAPAPAPGVGHCSYHFTQSGNHND